MLRRLLPPLLLLLALALPSAAGAAMQRIATGSTSDHPTTPRQALRKAEAVAEGRGHGRELTLALKDLVVRMPALKGAERRRAERLLARPTLGETASNEDGYTVPEHSGPFCSAHFCIHWVDSTADAPPGAAAGVVPGYVQTMSQVFENVYNVENGQLGWRAPVSDGSRGCPGAAPDCMNKTDVYIKNVGGQGVYGYSAPDPGQGTALSQHAYLVMDNDYSAQEFSKYGGDPLAPMEVTAAHEYNHVLQFGYDVFQDTWMLESTAVWMEDKVYTEINDYLQYLDPTHGGWAVLSSVPLTTFDSNSSDNPLNVKVYGDMVWNRWLDTRYGQDAPRIAWEHSLTSKPKSFAPGAYDGMLAGHGSNFFSAFTQFAADTAEWRAANSPFAEGSSFPDMVRGRTTSGTTVELRANAGMAGARFDHASFALLDVQPTNAARLKAVINSPRGVQTAVALVGRIGDETSGTYASAITRLPKGGPGSVTLTDPGRFSRITAVLINGDARTTGRYSATLQDWQWKGDRALLGAGASTDYTPPKIRRRSPGASQTGVARRPTLHIQFSEKMMNVGTRTVLLLAPGGHKVKATVKLRAGRKLQIKPSKPLRAGARYTVRLSRDIEDLGANELSSASRTWSFRTGS